MDERGREGERKGKGRWKDELPRCEILFALIHRHITHREAVGIGAAVAVSPKQFFGKWLNSLLSPATCHLLLILYPE